jgi:hypothetical protein
MRQRCHLLGHRAAPVTPGVGPVHGPKPYVGVLGFRKARVVLERIVASVLAALMRSHQAR